MNKLKKLINWWKSLVDNDPIFSCEVFKQVGCSHVEGFCCDMKTCTDLKNFRILLRDFKAMRNNSLLGTPK